MKVRSGLGSLLLAWAGAAAAQTAVWDEGFSGDLSNTGLSPTPLSFALGPNTVRGTTGNAGQGVDRDYFKFTVPPGAELASLRLLANTSVSGGASFIALQQGQQVTVTPSGAGAENLMGFVHYSNDLVGSDILAQLVFGFSGSLPSGTYSVWVQETGGPATYEFEFALRSTGATSADVPTLPEWAVLLAAGLLFNVAWRHAANREQRRF